MLIWINKNDDKWLYGNMNFSEMKAMTSMDFNG